MKKVLVRISFVLSLLLFVVGIYMFFNYLGKNDTMMLIFLGVTVLGLAGLILIIIFSVKKMNKIKDEINSGPTEE